MLNERDLVALREAYDRIRDTHELGHLTLIRLDVLTGVATDADQVRAAVEAFGPEQGWMIDIGAESRAKAFWIDSPEGSFDRVEGRLLEGECRNGVGQSLDVRHEAGTGWRVTIVAPAGEAPDTIGGLPLETAHRDTPFLLERTHFVTAFGAKPSAERDEPHCVRYAVAWQEVEEHAGLAPLLQIFEGFERAEDVGA